MILMQHPFHKAPNSSTILLGTSPAMGASLASMSADIGQFVKLQKVEYF